MDERQALEAEYAAACAEHDMLDDQRTKHDATLAELAAAGETETLARYAAYVAWPVSRLLEDAEARMCRAAEAFAD